MMLNATLNNISIISWWSVLLVEETGENHRPVASHWQTLSHNVVHLALIEIRTHNISGDKSNYHTITATTAPWINRIYTYSRFLRWNMFYILAPNEDNIPSMALYLLQCDKVCQWLATGRWFSPVSSTNKTDRQDIIEILFKVALSIIKQTNDLSSNYDISVHNK
jgi:hypothetical protein